MHVPHSIRLTIQLTIDQHYRKSTPKAFGVDKAASKFVYVSHA
jgi:hypothetical protein